MTENFCNSFNNYIFYISHLESDCEELTKPNSLEEIRNENSN